ncbi:MAG TPA: hypothetical protein VL049_22370 [Candidatus Dormibacteraeota bacterium]|nr:hypothetical protein [Candidatus Dormibacteraeota bacterium]
MKMSVIAVCLLIAGTALAQTNGKVKAIRAANEAADSANAVAAGVHKREAADPATGGGQAMPEKEGKPKPTPEPK